MLRQCEHLAIGQPFGIRPIYCVGFAQDHGDLLPLIHLRGAREQRPERVELCHDAAEGKNIYRVVVGSGAEDVLGGPVPPCRNIFGKWSRMPNLFDQAEIA